MMTDKYYLFILGLIITASCKNEPAAVSTPTPTPSNTKPTLQLVWESTAGLKTPESVIYDEKNNQYFVSCINGVPPNKVDQDGYIAKLDAQGKLITEKWITGLNAPKGFGILGDSLFVTDISDVVLISISQSKILKKFKIDGAKFLNDIDVDVKTGMVYISDTETNSIHMLQNDTVTDFIKNDSLLGNPNGLYINGGEIVGSSFGKGHVYTIDLASKKIQSKVDTLPGGDGVEKIENGYLVSNWNGEVYFIDNDWKKQLLINTIDAKRNAADIEYVPSSGLVLVPEFFANKVSAYKLN
jgi:hypothetical protein